MNILDTLTNLVTGLGTSKDKLHAAQFVFNPLSQSELESAYRGDWIARKIIDVPAQDATREWRDWKGEAQAVSAITAMETKIGLQHKICEAMKRARLHGGAALIIGVAGDDPEQPLDLETIAKDTLVYVHVAGRNELSAQEIDRDLESEFFGRPQSYTMSSDTGVASIHSSRIVPFVGAPILDEALRSDEWGDSVLQALYDAVRNAAASQQGIASLIQEAKVDVIRIPRMMSQLSTKEYTARLQERFMLATQMKSSMSVTLLDAEEDWQQKQVNFSQMPELLSQYLEIAAGAADIPATRLIGTSPKGLNATGDGDMRNYYDRIGADQATILRPALARLDEVLIRSALGSRPEEIDYRWTPLWRLSKSDEAEIMATKAKAIETIARTALVPVEPLGEATTNMLIEDGILSGLSAAMKQFNAEVEDLDDELDPV
jgi:phage-related protein (TIGR01555 family)